MFRGTHTDLGNLAHEECIVCYNRNILHFSPMMHPRSELFQSTLCKGKLQVPLQLLDLAPLVLRYFLIVTNQVQLGYFETLA